MNYVMLSDRTREGEIAIHVHDQPPGPQTQTLTRCGRHFHGADAYYPASLEADDRKCQDCFQKP